MEKRWKIFWLVLIVVVIGIWALLHYYYRTCENQTCFDDYLKECKKAKFYSSGKMVFEYKILGEDSDCKVNVKLLEGDLTNQESLKLEKREMVCSLPFGVVMVPEADLGRCTGQLKEGLQELIINKLYSYVVQNFGKINADLLKVS